MNALRVCDGCMRHVFVTETRCPFCEQALAPVATERVVVPNGLGRGQRLILAAALIGMSASGCNDPPQAPAGTPQLAGSGGGPWIPVPDAGTQFLTPAYGGPPLPFPPPLPGESLDDEPDNAVGDAADAGPDEPDAGPDEPDAG